MGKGGRADGTYVTAFSLDPECQEILSEQQNRSRFVREAIKAFETPTINQHIQPTGVGPLKLCNPFHVRGLCKICWPDGRPTNEGWFEYVEATRSGRQTSKPASAHVQAVAAHGRPKHKTQYEPFTVLGWLVALVASGIAVGLQYL